MLDIKFIRENQDLVRQNIKDRRIKVDLEEVLSADEKRRQLLHSMEEMRSERKKSSKTKPTPEIVEQMRLLGDKISEAEKDLAKVQDEFDRLMMRIPNLTHASSPRGGEDDYKVVATVGQIPKFDFKPKDHEELMTALGLIDFERAAKVSGAKFYFTKNSLVRLNHALISYGIDIITAHGYDLLETPDLAKNSILSGIGFDPRGPETQVYSVENTDLSLIGTAEITVGGFHSGEVLDLSGGPKKYVALSHCFRTEAGAYGRESKGLYRVHQFTKLEMFIFCKPEDSDKMHDEILSIEREIVDGLKLPYRVIDIASGDLGGPAYRKFDIEAYMTMKDGYGEITSTSNCTDYQARRLDIKYRTQDGKTAFAHTLNGTAVVLSRFPLAIFENYQTEHGTVMVPQVLRKYMGVDEIK